MEANKLELGAVYFGLTYEDDDFVYPLVQTYEYMGVDIYGSVESAEAKKFFFRFVGSQDSLELSERQLDLILDVPGLSENLEQWARNTSRAKCKK